MYGRIQRNLYHVFFDVRKDKTCYINKYSKGEIEVSKGHFGKEVWPYFLTFLWSHTKDNTKAICRVWYRSEVFGQGPFNSLPRVLEYCSLSVLRCDICSTTIRNDTENTLCRQLTKVNMVYCFKLFIFIFF